MNRKTLTSLSPGDVEGLRALVRVDYNVPLGPDGTIEDATRIDATIPTLCWLLDAGARPVLLSHLGRPGGKIVPSESLEPVARALARRLGRPVEFVRETDGKAALDASRELPADSVLLLENTRFLPGETSNDEQLAERLARLGDFYVNDAFGTTHRAHASTVGVASRLSPAVAGLLVESELAALSRLREGEPRPFVVAFGGAKISDKIDLVEAFFEGADTILLGGAMANTFLAAAGHPVGRSLVDDAAIDVARALLDHPGVRLELPVDLVVGDPAAPADSQRVVSADEIPPDSAAFDIGPETVERFGDVVRSAGTFFWNGPMGWFEQSPYDAGTRALAEAAAAAARSGTFAVIGGGDSARAVQESGLADEVSHVSTGGGASLEFLAHGTLPGLEALEPA